MNEAAEKIVGLIEKRMYGFAKIEESSNLYKDLGFDWSFSENKPPVLLGEEKTL